MPEVNFQDDDQLIERLNEFNRLKMEAESKAKKIDTEKKNLERELKKRKKEFHKVIQRSKSLRKNGENQEKLSLILKLMTFSFHFLQAPAQAATFHHNATSPPP